MHLITLFPIPTFQFTHGQGEKSSSRVGFVGIVVTDVFVRDVVHVPRDVFVGVETVAGVHVVGAGVELWEFWGWVSGEF